MKVGASATQHSTIQTIRTNTRAAAQSCHRWFRSNILSRRKTKNIKKQLWKQSKKKMVTSGKRVGVVSGDSTFESFWASNFASCFLNILMPASSFDNSTTTCHRQHTHKPQTNTLQKHTYFLECLRQSWLVGCRFVAVFAAHGDHGAASRSSYESAREWLFFVWFFCIFVVGYSFQKKKKQKNWFF